MVGLSPMRKASATPSSSLGVANPRWLFSRPTLNISDFSYLFGDETPDRFFNVGIAEQCLVDVAVGLAHSGCIPFVNTFAVFMASRALEPILTHLCYGRANVKLISQVQRHLAPDGGADTPCDHGHRRW